MYSCMSYDLVKALLNHVVPSIGFANVVTAKTSHGTVPTMYVYVCTRASVGLLPCSRRASVVCVNGHLSCCVKLLVVLVLVSL